MAAFWGAFFGTIVGFFMLTAILIYIDRNDKP